MMRTSATEDAREALRAVARRPAPRTFKAL
jgi:hypothetical protein